VEAQPSESGEPEVIGTFTDADDEYARRIMAVEDHPGMA
jgi:hypothetical protein